MNVVRNLFHLLDKRQKINVCILVVLSFIGGLLETLGVSAILPIMSVIMDSKTLDTNKVIIIMKDLLHIKDNTTIIVILLVGMIAIFVVKNVYLLLLTYLQARFVNRNKCRTTSNLLSSYLNKPYEYFLNSDTPTMLRVLGKDSSNIFVILTDSMHLLTEGITSVCLCIFLFLVDYKMTLLIITLLGVLSLFITKILKPRLNNLGRSSQKYSTMVNKWQLQSIYGIKDIKILKKEDYFSESHCQNAKKQANLESTYTVLNNMPRLLLETFCIAGILIYIIICILSGQNIASLIGALTAFALAAVRLLPSVSRINTYITNIAYCQPSLDYLHENISLAELNPTVKKMSKAEKTISFQDKIELQHITYIYPHTTRKIFDDASMLIPAGLSIGIMGPSGAGKTTIVDVLLGLLELQDGTITCDHVNIMDNYSEWLSHIGYIPQTIYLTDDTIKENIAFGVAPDQINERQIWNVIREAQLTEYVEQLPDSINTTIGERGVRMSGGQRQRLGIARALYHNSDILVFDEATSALDNDTEAAIMEAIDHFKGRKTMIIIAHRLKTIENCDLIYKVADGKIKQTTL